MTTSSETFLIIGATSSLAQALCHELASQGYDMVLVGRDQAELDLLSADLTVRNGISTTIVLADFLAKDFSTPRLIERVEHFNHVIIASGDMGGDDFTDLANITQTTWLNYTVPAHLATLAAERLRDKETAGTITIISSVAGDRGRQSNYIYGSAKAALTTFTSGLRNRYAKHKVHVMTVKPGFIDTPMTWGMKSPLIASREFVAKKIVSAIEKRKDVIYVPFFWRYIMLIIMHIPEKIFKKLSL